MRIDEILARADEPVFSFEFFPPKTEEGERNLREALWALRELEPDFVSVTYGAGGSTRGLTLELTKWIKQELGIEAMAHLSCVGATRDELCVILDSLMEAGIENVLALRGDPPRGETSWSPQQQCTMSAAADAASAAPLACVASASASRSASRRAVRRCTIPLPTTWCPGLQ